MTNCTPQSKHIVMKLYLIFAQKTSITYFRWFQKNNWSMGVSKKL